MPSLTWSYIYIYSFNKFLVVTSLFGKTTNNPEDEADRSNACIMVTLILTRWHDLFCFFFFILDLEA